MSEKKPNRYRTAGLWTVGLLAVATILIVLSITPLSKAVHFDCLTFRVMPDGSIQALVTVTAKNFDYLGGTQFNMSYNPAYIVPSDATTNKELTVANTTTFFTQDSKLYTVGGVSQTPFFDTNTSTAGPTGGLSTVGSDHVLTMAFYVNQNLKQSETADPGDKLACAPSGGAGTVTYIDAKGDAGAVLGTISFRVVSAKLTEMVSEFGGSGPTIPNNFLVQFTKAMTGQAEVWAIEEYENKGSSGAPELAMKTYKSNDTTPGAGMYFHVSFPKSLVKATPAVPEVTVNAYEAYRTGNPADLAETLQVHSPTVRAGYADGSFEDFVLPWNGAGTDFKLYTADGSRTEITALNYSAKGGEYLAEQSFTYKEGGGTKTFPVKMAVKLHVAPVNLTGVQARDLTKSYRNEQGATGTLLPPATPKGLGLPTQALLVTDRVPGTASFVMPLPLDSWLNNGTVFTDMTTVKDTNNTTPWPAATGAGAGTYRFTQAVSHAEIGTAYPWLTVTGDRTDLVATRTISTGGSYLDPRCYTLTAEHRDLAESGGSVVGTAVLTIKKNNGAATPAQVPMLSGDVFQVRMPNGAIVPASLQATQEMGTPTIYYQLVLSPGASPVGDADILRRYINLGGWFGVGMRRAGETVFAAEELRVYLSPRENVYLQDETFDFTGFNAGLFPFHTTSVLGKTIVLPLGSAPTEQGKPYTVATTYDGGTGGEPGALGTFTVTDWTSITGNQGGTPGAWKAADPAATPNPTKGEIATYGPGPFAGAYYDGYGKVENPTASPKTVKLMAQVGETPLRPDEQLTLTKLRSAAGDAAVTTNAAGEVQGVIYDGRQQGYPTRQGATLTLKNVGKDDIYGLRLDTAPGSHFEILSPPAPYLAAGQSTDFVISYVFDLKSTDPNETGQTYKDSISVYSNGSAGTALKTFTAEFRVSAGPVSQVTVRTNSPLTAETPKAPIMGGASIIAGLGEKLPTKPSSGEYETKTDPTQIEVVQNADVLPNSAPGISSREQNYKYVWLRTETYDEYVVDGVYYVDHTGAKQYLPRYEYNPAKPDWESAHVAYYFFKMPGYDVTVQVDFAEPVRSKLRLALLDVQAKTDTTALASQEVRWYKDTTKLVNTTTHLLTMEESGLDHFITVLPQDTDAAKFTKAQVTIDLRKVLAQIPPPAQPSNGDIPVTVSMTLVVPGSPDTLVYGPVAHTTAGAINITTTEFAAPDPGRTVDVKIAVSHSTGGSTPVTTERTVTLTLTKPSAQVEHKLYAGNSPYGMIANDALITDKAAARLDFEKAYRFTGTKALTPSFATGLTNTYYPAVWGSGPNYDRDPKALFVYPGQPFDDPGAVLVKNSANQEVPPEKITRTVVVDLMIPGADTQTGKFSSSLKQKLELTPKKGSNTIETWGMNGTIAYDIRPGAYEMVYSFPDYDGTHEKYFTRPLIILPRVGDVDANRTVDNKDAELLIHRVTDPLGYALGSATWGGADLYRFRVCDVNNDMHLNHIDANLALGGKAIAQYYKPTGYYDPAHPQPANQP